jgi:hypothetical protein
MDRRDGGWTALIALLALLMAVGLEAARATRRAREYPQLAVARAAFRALSLGEAEAVRSMVP